MILLFGSVAPIAALANTINEKVENRSLTASIQSGFLPDTYDATLNPATYAKFLAPETSGTPEASITALISDETTSSHAYYTPEIPETHLSDDVTFGPDCRTAIPEPLSYGFMALGLIAVGLGARRQKQR